MTKTINISKAFEPLYTTKKRYILITGGRGSLKSTSVHDFIARLTYTKGHGILFTRYTMTSAELSIIPEFQETLKKLGIEIHFTISKNKITNKLTDSFIIFSGIKTSSGDQTANLKSLTGITTWVIEEGEDFKDEKKFNTIDDSIRSTSQQNRIIWIMNPTTKEHFIYQKFIAPSNIQKEYAGYLVTVSNYKDVEHIHTTYHIAEELGYLQQSWLDKAHKYEQQANELELKKAGSKYKTHFYYNYIGGWLERAEGAIFDNWEEGEFDAHLPYLYALDWGYYPDPLAISKVAVNESHKIIYIHEMFCDTENNDVSQIFSEIKISKFDLIVCDTNEPRTRANLTKLGWNIQNVVKNAVMDDIREIKQYKIIVTPESNNIKAAFNNYVWNDKKASIPGTEWKHFPDTLRYGFIRLTAKQGFQAYHAHKNLV